MPWPLQFQPESPAPADRRAGMYWFGKNEIAPSPNFVADWRGKRPMLVIVCPDGTLWVPDQCPTYGSNTDTGWKVIGELPCISVHPSIGKPGYHGWLRDGVLSDDLEGRTYNESAGALAERSAEPTRAGTERHTRNEPDPESGISPGSSIPVERGMV